jgi:Tfp pilus assembly protein PilO
MNRLGSTDRLWLIGGVLAAAGILGIGWFFLIGPQLDQASSLRGQASDTQQHIAVLHRGLIELRQQNDDLPRYRAELAVDQQALPSTAASADFLRVLQSLGDQTGVSISAITVSGSTAIVGNAKVRALPIIITASGTTKQLNAFLDRLQQVQPRAVLINHTDLSADDANGPTGSYTLSVSLDAFVASTSGTS